jgi:hypothetical protein
MGSELSLKDFASCVSCDRMVMFLRPKSNDNKNKKKSQQNAQGFHATVCYTCERDGAAAPQHDLKGWGSNSSPTFRLSSSLVKGSVKFVAASKLVEGDIKCEETDGKVNLRPRHAILHHYKEGCRVVTVNLENIDATAVECPYLETGFF